jgi:hypothetical protein
MSFLRALLSGKPGFPGYANAPGTLFGFFGGTGIRYAAITGDTPGKIGEIIEKTDSALLLCLKSGCDRWDNGSPIISAKR